MTGHNLSATSLCDDIAQASLAEWVLAQDKKSNSQLANQTLKLQWQAPWYLWIEPLPKSTPEHCPVLFSDWQSLQQVLQQGWQLSEFCFFSSHQFIHGRALSNGGRLLFVEHNHNTKEMREAAQSSEALATPFLRQDLAARSLANDNGELRQLAQQHKQLKLLNIPDQNDTPYLFLLPAKEAK